MANIHEYLSNSRTPFVVEISNVICFGILSLLSDVKQIGKPKEKKKHFKLFFRNKFVIYIKRLAYYTHINPTQDLLCYSILI
jgi:hypothetical protein